MSIFSRRQKPQSSRRSQSIKPQTKPSDSQTTGDKLKAGLVSGIKKGWHSFLWMAKILVPLSFAVALLKWSGWLIKVDFVLNPVMNLINLPSEAALPILSGFFINIYAVMAILLVVPFSTGQATLIAVFSMIAHNLITEAIIQHKSGINAFKIVAIRLAIAIVTVLLMSLFIDNTSRNVAGMIAIEQQPTLLHALLTWTKDTGFMLLKMFGIVMGIMIVLDYLSRLGWETYLFRFFRPFMRILGLADQSVMLWVTAVIFGLTYGGAVILEKSKEGVLNRSEAERLHISIGINHSLVEDTALFMAMGMSFFWLVIPKLLMSIVAVQVYRGWEFVKHRLSKQTAG